MAVRMATALFPQTEPVVVDFLDVGDGHRLCYEICGKHNGVPALIVHGGPGSKSSPSNRRFFDPNFYRIIQFDQRGCGRSTPFGEIENNNTDKILSDIDLLRRHLGIDRWLVLGGSWGSTLALLYAQTHPDRVMGLVLRGVFFGTDAEVAWYLGGGMQQFVPEAWATLAQGLPVTSCEALVAHYHQHIEAGDTEAAKRWDTYEGAVGGIALPPPAPASPTTPADLAAMLARQRIHLHYTVNHFFLAPDQLLRGISRSSHLPLIIVQGRLDLLCPAEKAFRLQHAWGGVARVKMVEEGGHLSGHPGISGALVQATEEMKTLAMHALH